MNLLPEGNGVDAILLSNVFKEKTNSYKFLWLKGIILLLEDSNYSSPTLSFTSIVKEMLVFSWFPNQYYKLSFGYWDKIYRFMDQLDVDVCGKVSSKNVRIAVDSMYSEEAELHLTRYVPYRMLTSWFKNELYGIEDDSRRHKKTVELASEFFEQSVPLYKIEGREIVIHHSWLVYLKENSGIIKGWLNWHWSNYLQDRNPSVPNVSKKIEIIETRGALTKQKKYWQNYIQDASSACLYTGSSLKDTGFTLDHFVPWTYVVHDEPWNIVPVTKVPNVNSSKSNNLPAVECVDSFIERQYGMIQYNNSRSAGRVWKNLIAPYGELLRLSEIDLLNEKKFTGALKEVIIMHMEGAKRLGFSDGWKYQG